MRRVWKFVPLSILDRYILRQFLGTFFFALLLLLTIIVVFDINEKIDAFLKAPISATINDYFLNFIPYFANQFAPLFTFIAVIFFSAVKNNAVVFCLHKDSICLTCL